MCALSGRMVPPGSCWELPAAPPASLAPAPRPPCGRHPRTGSLGRRSAAVPCWQATARRQGRPRLPPARQPPRPAVPGSGGGRGGGCGLRGGLQLRPGFLGQVLTVLPLHAWSKRSLTTYSCSVWPLQLDLCRADRTAAEMRCKPTGRVAFLSRIG